MRTQPQSEPAHAPLPPSASERWINCPASQGYIKHLIDSGEIKKRASGAAAERGTRIHALGEQFIKWLLAGKKIDSFNKGDEGEINEARDYARFCLSLVDEMSLIYDKIETGIEDRAIIDGDVCWGSRDFWVMGGDEHLIVVDLKTGREPVSVKDNTQLISYAMDLAARRPKKIELIIWQPRASDGGAPDRRYSYTPEEFDAIALRIRNGAEAAARWLDRKRGFEKGLVAGDHCGYCDALGVCSAAKSKALEISSKNFTPVPVDRAAPPDPATLQADQVSEILNRAGMFRSWLDAVGTRAMQLIAQGQTVAGYKVVQRITRDQWESSATDAQIAKATGIAKGELTKIMRLTPAQVRKKLPKEKHAKLQRFIFKPEGGPTLVPDTDRRVPLQNTKINFDAITHEEQDDG